MDLQNQKSQSTQQPVSVPPLRQTKDSTNFIIIVLCIGAITIAGIFYLLSGSPKNSTPTPAVAPSASIITWKLFKDTTLGFQAELPSDLVASPASEIVFDDKGAKEYLIQFIPENTTIQNLPDVNNLVIRKIPVGSSSAAQEAASFKNEVEKNTESKATLTDITVAGQKGKVVAFDSLRYVFIATDKVYFYIIKLSIGSKTTAAQASEIYNHLLSTFKFL